MNSGTEMNCRYEDIMFDNPTAMSISISYMSTPNPYAAILHAFSGRACILITAGLMYPQNVTTPMIMHRIFTT